MKKTAALVATILLVFTCFNSFSSTLSDESFEKIMELSGLNKQVGEYPKAILVGIDQAHQQNPTLPEKNLEDLKKMIVQAFKAESFLSSIGREIRTSLSEEDARELITWYESEIGRKITIAEEEASKPEAIQQMFTEAQSLMSDPERVNLARQIDFLVGGTDITMQMQMDTAVAVFTSIVSTQKEVTESEIENFRKQLAAQEIQMRENVEMLTIASFLYSYKDIDIGEIKQYIEFLGRPKVMNFNTFVIRGLKASFDKATKDLSKSLAIEFSNNIT